MPKIKLTKNELKKQKDSLRMFSRYLPMLVLKKQQLQAEINKVHAAIDDISAEADNLRKNVIIWVDVFAQDIDLCRWAGIEEIQTETGNIAGIDIPVFTGVLFIEEQYDFMDTPLWIDKGIEVLKETAVLRAKLTVYRQQLDILKEELRLTTQRVNLFEKIKIPQGKENIRVINIFLGDLRTAEVVRGKIAKNKIGMKARIGIEADLG